MLGYCRPAADCERLTRQRVRLVASRAESGHRLHDLIEITTALPYPRPRGARQPRATRRSRSRSTARAARAAGPSCPPAPAPAGTRRSSCATATRPATAARACARPSPTSATCSPRDCSACRRREQAAHRPHAVRAGRHAEQVAARGQRDPRRVAGLRPCRGGGRGTAAVAIPRRGRQRRACRCRWST